MSTSFIPEAIGTGSDDGQTRTQNWSIKRKTKCNICTQWPKLQFGLVSTMFYRARKKYTSDTSKEGYSLLFKRFEPNGYPVFLWQTTHQYLQVKSYLAWRQNGQHICGCLTDTSAGPSNESNTSNSNRHSFFLIWDTSTFSKETRALPGPTDLSCPI